MAFPDDKTLASAWRGLEGPLCDLKLAISIATTLAEDMMHEGTVKDGYRTLLLQEEATDCLLFALYEVNRRAQELKDSWYAVTEAKS